MIRLTCNQIDREMFVESVLEKSPAKIVYHQFVNAGKDAELYIEGVPLAGLENWLESQCTGHYCRLQEVTGPIDGPLGGPFNPQALRR